MSGLWYVPFPPNTTSQNGKRVRNACDSDNAAPSPRCCARGKVGKLHRFVHSQQYPNGIDRHTSWSLSCKGWEDRLWSSSNKFQGQWSVEWRLLTSSKLLIIPESNDQQSGGCLRVVVCWSYQNPMQEGTGRNCAELPSLSLVPTAKLLSLGRNGEARAISCVSRWSRLQTQSSKHEWCIRNGLIRSSQNIHQKNHKIEKFHRCAVCVTIVWPAYREKWRCESYITDHNGLTSPKNHRNKKIKPIHFLLS